MDHSPRFLGLVESIRPHVREIGAAEVAAALQAAGPSGPLDFVLIDVREDHEWSLGHLPRATHLGRGILERDIERAIPDVEQQLVLYCGGGFRSALAARSLEQMGYRNVLSLAGGFRGWKEAGLPVE